MALHFCSVFTGLFLSPVVTYLKTNTKPRIPGFIITTSETVTVEQHREGETHLSSYQSQHLNLGRILLPKGESCFLLKLLGT